MNRVLLTIALAAFSLSAQESTKKPAGAQAKVVDPVCGMSVDPKASEKSIYKGTTYYFCSRSEKRAFDKSPEKYVPRSK